ncbi:MAG: ABC transporter [Proteobacteria bacterium]|nr:ABC transporter [Pseudomonadota bacterium]
MSKNNQFPRGAEWRKWDLHIHTPASIIQNYGQDNDETWEKFICDLEKLPKEFSAIGINDYLFLDGYEKVLERKKKGRLKNIDLILPVLEFRLRDFAGVDFGAYKRPNIHVIFADETVLATDIIKSQFLNTLDFRYRLEKDDKDFSRTLNKASLIELGNEIIKSAPEHEKSKYDSPIIEGFNNLNLTLEQIQNPLKKNCFEGKYLLAIGKTEWGELKWSNASIGNKKTLINSCHIVFTSAESVNSFEEAKKKLRSEVENDLLLDCSDAHTFSDSVNKDGIPIKDRIGKCFTWIKADPTFRGLLQAIKEPSKRSYIGEKPDKLRIVEENRTFFIDELSISKINTQTSIGEWFDGVKIPLNSDLVAIIGEKGSGKSAIADIIALLGNSHQHESFSFLNEKRFRGKASNLAKHFNANLTWKSGAPNNQNLNKNPDEGSVELIRYLPQSYFENLCNEHTDDGHRKFQEELRKVIFNHLDDSARLEASDFEQLVDRQEKTFRDQLDEYRKNLSRINLDIQGLELQSQGWLRKQLEELLELKTTQIAEHDKIKPEALTKPSEEQSLEQKEVNSKIEENAKKLLEIATNKTEKSEGLLLIAKKLNAIKAITDGFQMLERQYNSFQESNSANFEILGLQHEMLVRLEVSHFGKLSTMKTALEQEEKESRIFCAELENQRSELTLKQEDLKKKLNEPQLLYQKNCEDIKRWEEARITLIGPENSVANQETFNGLKASIADLDKIPLQLDSKRKQRLQLTEEIFNALNAKREAREKLFKPLQDFIESHPLIKADNKLKFQSNLSILLDILVTKLFEIIKQYSGEFNKEHEGHIAIKQLSESCSFNSKDGVLKFVQKLYNMICGNNESFSYRDLRKNKTLSEVYDLVFGLSYLEPQYSLLFEEAEGQRPIVLDQPEENLDNETVFSLLAPVIIEAKKQRQIIMVTHNPNLAIVCDAEQIIHSSFDRKTMKASYTSGSIENPIFNGHAVNVLEGTKPAFDNRKNKYH